MYRRADETRAAILAAAVETISQRGEAALRVSEVAAACRVSVAAIYLHFTDREALVCAALAARFAENFWHDFPFIERAVDDAESPQQFRDTIMGLARAIFAPERAETRLERAATIGMTAWRPELRTALGEFYRSYNHQVGELLHRAKARGFVREDVDSASLAQLTQILYVGTVVRDVTDPTSDEIEASIRIVESIFASFLPVGIVQA